MQPREKLVLEFWDRSKELTIKNKEYKNFLRKFLSHLLEQDIARGDLTTESLIKENKNISAVIIAKESGILAGLEELKFLNKDLKMKQLKKDGDKIKNSDILIKISGNAKKILSRERIFLNLLQRMSGIATLTKSLNEKINNKIRIASTRKTLWGLLDKKAVSLGGGLTHRLNLNEGIIVKDTHLKIFNYNIKQIINSVKNKSKYIEIEVEDKNQALTAAKAIKNIIKEKNIKNFFAIMLDKIYPNEIKSIVKDLKNMNLYDYVLLEASGNITPENLIKYADCGVDVISMGYITNSAKSLDMSLDIIK